MFKRFVLILCALLILCPIFGAEICAFDFAGWYEAPLYTVLDDGTPSNSAVDCIFVRVKRDDETHRLHLLFMTEMKSFGAIENAGVKMSFDDLSEIVLMCDGTGEYDDSEYFAEMTDMIYDDKSMTVYMDVTVGIKSGLPDVMYFSIFDTDGVISNSYTVELESEADETDEADVQNKTEKSSKTKKIKTTKVKTTKVKTTKKKTTKVKTTKESRTEKTEEGYSIEQKSASVSLDKEIPVSNDRHLIVTVCSAAVIACAAGGCAVGIAKIIKKQNTDQG